MYTGDGVGPVAEYRPRRPARPKPNQPAQNLSAHRYRCLGQKYRTHCSAALSRSCRTTAGAIIRRIPRAFSRRPSMTQRHWLDVSARRRHAQATLTRRDFRLFEISESEQNLGSQSGSRRRQTSRDALRQPAIVPAARQLVGRQQATYPDAVTVTSKQRFAGSNPAGRASEIAGQRPYYRLPRALMRSGTETTRRPARDLGGPKASMGQTREQSEDTMTSLIETEGIAHTDGPAL